MYMEMHVLIKKYLQMVSTASTRLRQQDKPIE